MKPVIALVGRPNVGKSTLFNYLTKSKDALVADQPGLTRDRIYGITRRFDYRYIVIDTGGIAPVDPSNEKNEMNEAITEQAWLAIEEADVVFFIVDCTEGLVPQDVDIFKKIRNSNQKIFIIVNKSDFNPQNKLTNEFYELGVQTVFEISAKSGKGVRDIFSELEIFFPIKEEESVEEAKIVSIKVALIGKPNVGKSTLANALIGEERFVTSEIPGTTRDSISVVIEKFGTQFELIDTAGVRKRSKVHDLVEKFSVVKTLQAIE